MSHDGRAAKAADDHSTRARRAARTRWGDTTPAEDEAAELAALEFGELASVPAKPEQLAVPLEDFLAEYPRSAWNPSILTNLGLVYYRSGYFSRALAAWGRAWSEGRHATEPRAKALVDRALGELARMHARVGHLDELEELFEDIGERPVSGPANQAMTGAREGAWEMRHRPRNAFLCGSKALGNTLRALGASAQGAVFADDARSGARGFTLGQVAQLADYSGLPHRLIHRTPSQAIPVPSVINWKLDHYAAIVAEREDGYHIKDPTFGGDLVVSRTAIDAESSGYFLVPVGGQEDSAWRDVGPEEAETVHGMGFTSSNQEGAVTGDDLTPHGACDQGIGMCVPDAHVMNVSLNLKDTPVGYEPQKGPSALVRLTYNQREANQPANFAYFNVGSMWSLSVLSLVEFLPGSPDLGVVRHLPGGGSRTYSGYNGTGAFAPEKQTGAVLRRTPAGGTPTSFTLDNPDGSKLVYAHSDGGTKRFLSSMVDPQGNAMTLTYNGLKLTSFTDAAGRATTFTYGNPIWYMNVTAITDPFGRTASLQYDGSGRLIQITDVVGITSSFTYDGNGLVNALQTPYGTSTFRYGDAPSRYLDITDPLGKTERIEFLHAAPGVESSDPVVPGGMTVTNTYLHYRNTFYWDKHTYPTSGTGAGKDYTKAKRWHWLHTGPNNEITSPILESVKEPLERRVWYMYPGQTSPTVEGSSGRFVTTKMRQRFFEFTEA